MTTVDTSLPGDSWWQMLTATFLAVVFTQFAFIGHDAGHKQIFRTSRRNNLVGYLHGGITGISYQWWVGKHNLHHANPNHEDHDPDIEIAALAFSREQSRTKQGVYRWITNIKPFCSFRCCCSKRPSCVSPASRRYYAVRSNAPCWKPRS